MPNRSGSEILQGSSVMLCGGKDCAKKQRSAFKNLRSTLRSAGATVTPVECQGSCAGPTAVIRIGGDVRWFERLQGASSQHDLAEIAVGERSEVTRRLAKRELTGKKRAKAAKKLGVR